MKILISNDDGYGSPGIEALASVLSRSHEVCIVAPNQERSGCSHSITLITPVQFKKAAPLRFTCSGTPADCVLYTLLGAVDFKPDCVVSGINRGPNLGTDILYSGTAAAARQAALSGLPAIAVSSSIYQGPFQFEKEAEFLLEKLDTLISGCPERAFINVNFPKNLNSEVVWKECFPAVRHYNDHIQTVEAADHSKWIFLSGEPVGALAGKGSDWSEVMKGNISFSTIKIDPLHVEK